MKGNTTNDYIIEHPTQPDIVVIDEPIHGKTNQFKFTNFRE